MITCRELAESLFDLTSGELAAAHREQVEEHVRLCPSCLAYQRELLRDHPVGPPTVRLPLPPAWHTGSRAFSKSEAV